MDTVIMKGTQSHKNQYESNLVVIEISKAPLTDDGFRYSVKTDTYYALAPNETVRTFSSDTIRYYTDDLDVEDFTNETEALKYKIENLLGTFTWS